jgi:hypothetical protein
MKRNMVVLLFSIVTLLVTQRIEGRNRLTTLSAEQTKDDYYLILRRVFHRLYDADVVAAELFAVGGGSKESAVGVLKSNNGPQAFALFASASVWETDLPRLMRGITESCVDDAGKEIQCPPQNRPKTGPEGKEIKVTMKTRSLPADLATRIQLVWKSKVNGALRLPPMTDKERGFVGGFTHYYSIRSSSHGWSTVLGQTGGEGTDTERMAALANVLKGYAGGRESEDALRKALAPLEVATKSFDRRLQSRSLGD